ncbi:hypothetical protein AB0N05_37550 [Nocardia sp. NPDC051030]|uniref:hypothetical protein n=1 Tax=Nocardia sp. NPDC051030 TaxID=3155162 RepID=UPI003418A8A4
MMRRLHGDPPAPITLAAGVSDHRRYLITYEGPGVGRACVDAATALAVYDRGLAELTTLAAESDVEITLEMSDTDHGRTEILHHEVGPLTAVLDTLVVHRGAYLLTDRGEIDFLHAELDAANVEIAQLRTDNTTLVRMFTTAPDRASLATAVDRYQQLATISSTLDHLRRDAILTDGDRHRIEYDNDVRILLTAMLADGPLSEADQRVALSKLEDPATVFTDPAADQSAEGLYRQWITVRRALDHDLAALGGLERLLTQVRGLDRSVEDLRTDHDTTASRLAVLTGELDRLDQDNMALSDQLDRARDHDPSCLACQFDDNTELRLRAVAHPADNAALP